MMLVGEPLLLADTDPAGRSALAAHLETRGFAVDAVTQVEVLAHATQLQGIAPTCSATGLSGLGAATGSRQSGGT